jgi:hypothetical protein
VHGKEEALLDLAFETGYEVRNEACIYGKGGQVCVQGSGLTT